MYFPSGEKVGKVSNQVLSASIGDEMMRFSFRSAT